MTDISLVKGPEVAPKPTALVHDIPLDCDYEKHRPTIFCDCGPVPHPSDSSKIVHRGADWKPAGKSVEGQFVTIMQDQSTDEEWEAIQAWKDFFNVTRSQIGTMRGDSHKQPEVA